METFLEDKSGTRTCSSDLPTRQLCKAKFGFFLNNEVIKNTSALPELCVCIYIHAYDRLSHRHTNKNLLKLFQM